MPVSKDKAMPAASAKWLTIVGIGEDGACGLGDAARRAIGEAAHVFGGRRHLALARDLITGQTHPWRHPFDISMRDVIEYRPNRVCVLASGDPYFYGVGTTLSRVISSDEIIVMPVPSSFSLAAARLGWSLQDTQLISLHDAPLASLRRYLQPGRQILALTSGSDSPHEIADYLSAAGFGASPISVLEALGGDHETVTTHTAKSFAANAIQPLNIVAILVRADNVESWSIPLAPGLPDDRFAHDGQITKRQVRALTLAALAPRHGELLWDIGAGAGSIAIEWMLAQPAMQAIAIERDAIRAARISANAVELGVPSLRVVIGSAPAALDGLPTPDAVFIGGGGMTAGLMDAAMAALPAGGRLVANAVTLAMENALYVHWQRHGGELTRLAVSNVEPLGAMSTWRPALPVTQWSWTKLSGV